MPFDLQAIFGGGGTTTPNTLAAFPEQPAPPYTPPPPTSYLGSGFLGGLGELGLGLGDWATQGGFGQALTGALGSFANWVRDPLARSSAALAGPTGYHINPHATLGGMAAEALVPTGGGAQLLPEIPSWLLGLAEPAGLTVQGVNALNAAREASQGGPPVTLAMPGASVTLPAGDLAEAGAGLARRGIDTAVNFGTDPLQVAPLALGAGGSFAPLLKAPGLLGAGGRAAIRGAEGVVGLVFGAQQAQAAGEIAGRALAERDAGTLTPGGLGEAAADIGLQTLFAGMGMAAPVHAARGLTPDARARETTAFDVDRAGGPLAPGVTDAAAQAWAEYQAGGVRGVAPGELPPVLAALLARRGALAEPGLGVEQRFGPGAPVPAAGLEALQRAFPTATLTPEGALEFAGGQRLVTRTGLELPADSRGVLDLPTAERPDYLLGTSDRADATTPPHERAHFALNSALTPEEARALAEATGASVADLAADPTTPEGRVARIAAEEVIAKALETGDAPEAGRLWGLVRRAFPEVALALDPRGEVTRRIASGEVFDRPVSPKLPPGAAPPDLAGLRTGALDPALDVRAQPSRTKGGPAPTSAAGRTRAALTAAREHGSWRDWYARHAGTLERLFGEDAPLFQRVLAATSQKNTVAGNVRAAVRAFEALKTGSGEFQGLPAVRANLERIRKEEALRGPKIGAYEEAVQGGASGVAVDRHITEFFFDTKKPTKTQHRLATAAIESAARKLGWEPREVQSAVWAANQIRRGRKVRDYAEVLEDYADAIAELRAAGAGGEGESVPAGRSAVAGGEGAPAGERAGELGAPAAAGEPTAAELSAGDLPAARFQPGAEPPALPSRPFTDMNEALRWLKGEGFDTDELLEGRRYFPKRVLAFANAELERFRALESSQSERLSSEFQQQLAAHLQDPGGQLGTSPQDFPALVRRIDALTTEWGLAKNPRYIGDQQPGELAGASGEGTFHQVYDLGEAQSGPHAGQALVLRLNKLHEQEGERGLWAPEGDPIWSSRWVNPRLALLETPSGKVAGEIYPKLVPAIRGGGDGRQFSDAFTEQALQHLVDTGKISYPDWADPASPSYDPARASTGTDLWDDLSRQATEHVGRFLEEVKKDPDWTLLDTTKEGHNIGFDGEGNAWFFDAGAIVPAHLLEGQGSATGWKAVEIDKRLRFQPGEKPPQTGTPPPSPFQDPEAPTRRRAGLPSEWAATRLLRAAGVRADSPFMRAVRAASPTHLDEAVAEQAAHLEVANKQLKALGVVLDSPWGKDAGPLKPFLETLYSTGHRMGVLSRELVPLARTAGEALREHGISTQDAQTWYVLKHYPQREKVLKERAARVAFNPTQEAVLARAARIDPAVRTLSGGALRNVLDATRDEILQDGTLHPLAVRAHVRAVEKVGAHIRAVVSGKRKIRGVAGGEFESADWRAAETARLAPIDKVMEERVAPAWRALAEWNLNTAVDSGLISERAATQMRETFGDYWLPLRHEDGLRLGGGVAKLTRALGPEAFGGRGPDAPPAEPFPLLVRMASNIATKAVRNKSLQELGRVVEATQNLPQLEGLWSVDPKIKGRFDPRTGNKSKRVYLAPDGKTKLGTVGAVDPSLIRYAVGGKERKIWIADPTLRESVANAYANATTPGRASAVGIVLASAARKLVGLVSRTATSWNPEWMLTQNVRDFGEALVNLGVDQEVIPGFKHGPKGLAKLGRALLPQQVDAARTIFWHESQEAGAHPRLTGRVAEPSPKQKQRWQEFQENAGRFSFGGFRELTDPAGYLESELRQTTTAALARAGHRVASVLGVFADVSELSTRFAAYNLLRDHGVKAPVAAGVARELTVNFGRQGTKGPQLKTLYAFVNPRIQGLRRLTRGLEDPRTRGRWLRYAGQLAALGAASSVWNAALGQEDDQGRNPEGTVSQSDLDTTATVLPDIGQGFSVKLPLPPGWGVFASAGRHLTRHQLGFTSGKQAFAHLLSTFVNGLNPLGSGDLSDPRALLQVVTPTPLDPLAQLGTNRNWHGTPLAPEGFPGSPARPDSSMYFASEPSASVAVAQGLNELTGGSEFEPGLVDLNPATVSLWTGFVLGGTGRSVERAGKAAWKTGKAVATFSPGELPPAREVPVLRNFVTAEPYPAADSVRFREALSVASQVHYRATHGDASVGRTERAAAERFRKLAGAVRKLQQRAADLPAGPAKTRLEAQARELQARATTAWDRAVGYGPGVLPPWAEAAAP